MAGCSAGPAVGYCLNELSAGEPPAVVPGGKQKHIGSSSRRVCGRVPDWGHRRGLVPAPGRRPPKFSFPGWGRGRRGNPGPGRKSGIRRAIRPREQAFMSLKSPYALWIWGTSQRGSPTSPGWEGASALLSPSHRVTSLLSLFHHSRPPSGHTPGEPTCGSRMSPPTLGFKRGEPHPLGLRAGGCPAVLSRPYWSGTRPSAPADPSHYREMSLHTM